MISQGHGIFNNSSAAGNLTSHKYICYNNSRICLCNHKRTCRNMETLECKYTADQIPEHYHNLLDLYRLLSTLRESFVDKIANHKFTYDVRKNEKKKIVGLTVTLSGHPSRIRQFKKDMNVHGFRQ